MFRIIFILQFIPFTLLFSINVPVCLADEFSEMYQVNDNICRLIEEGKFSQAKSAISKMAIEYVGQEKLPEMLYWVAERYKRFDRFEDAKQIYQQIVRDFPESPWSGKAKFCIARADVMISFMAQDYNAANAAIEKMAIDFANNADLPEALFWIAERFKRVDRFEDAKRIYQQIVDNFPESSYAKKARFNIAKADATLLIISQKYDQAKDALDKLAVDFAGNPDLPEAFFWIAERYKRVDRFEDAKLLYQKIIQDFPGNPYANKAIFNIARADIMISFMAQDYNEVSKAIDKLTVDFAKRPDLPEALYWLTERYERAVRPEEAKRNYQRIIELFPYSSWAKKATLGIPRAEVIALVESQDFNRADAALNKMACDFNGHPDLPGTLYWLAERYKVLNRPEDVNRIYQQIVANYPEHPYARRVATEHKEFLATEGTEIKNFSLNNEVNKPAEAEKPVLIEVERKAVELYRIAREYEEDPNKVPLARQTYEQIIKEYPGTIKADNAVLDIRRVEIREAFEAGDINTAEKLLMGFMSDFSPKANQNPNPYVNICLDQLAERYYTTALALKKANKPSMDYFAKAERIWQQIINMHLLNVADMNNPAAGNNPADIVGKAYYYAAGCRQQWNNWDGALEYFQKVVDGFPNYEHACGAQAAIGWCYESLRDLNEAPKEAVNPLAEDAYKAVLGSYKDCYAASYAAFRLGELSMGKNDKVNAVAYYRKFLTLAKPDDIRRDYVNKRLTLLEGTGTPTQPGAGKAVEGGTGK